MQNYDVQNYWRKLGDFGSLSIKRHYYLLACSKVRGKRGY